MQETWVQSLDWEDPLEKEMATHCCILAWEVPWTEEPGGLQSMGLQRVGHDGATKQQQQQQEYNNCLHLWLRSNPGIIIIIIIIIIISCFLYFLVILIGNYLLCMYYILQDVLGTKDTKLNKAILNKFELYWIKLNLFFWTNIEYSSYFSSSLVILIYFHAHSG